MRQFIENAAGLSIYPIMSFIIFFTCFLIVLVRLALMKKEYVDEMSNLPLEDTQAVHPGGR